MLRSNVKQLMLGAASAAVLMASSFAAHAGDTKFPPHAKTNIKPRRGVEFLWRSAIK